MSSGTLFIVLRKCCCCATVTEAKNVCPECGKMFIREATEKEKIIVLKKWVKQLEKKGDED